MRHTRSVAVAVALLLAGAGCGGGGDGDGGDGGDGIDVGPTIGLTAPPTSGLPTVLAIVAPATGDQIGGNVVRLDVTSSGITIVPADGSTSGARGHYHVFVDRDPGPPGTVIPVEAGIIHTTDDPIFIPGLSVGPHRLTVVYGDGSHRRLGYSEAATSFTVVGPSVDASAPPNWPAGQPVVVDVGLQGLAVPADALLYVLVDRDSPPAGQPIPDEPGVVQASAAPISVPDLGPGTHTLWVVAGSAERVPLDPPVMDKVTVTVG